MKKRTLVAAAAAAAFGLLGTAAPSSAKAAEVDVSWRFVPGGRGNPADACLDPKVTSDKDISNIVYVLADGTTHVIELSDEEQGPEYTVAGEVTGIWVKSGSNKDGDEGGLGEYFEPIAEGEGVEGANCTSDGGGLPPA